MSERLSARDWVAAGYAALKREGFRALKADVLAKQLNVSRGSFYWHFEDVGAFHRSVITHWRDVETEAVITALQDQPPGAERLEWLLRGAFRRDASAELAMRAWAAHDEDAAAAVAAVDRRRLGYVDKLLREQQIDAARAKALAAMYYWTYLGNALSQRKPDRQLMESVIAEFAALTRG